MGRLTLPLLALLLAGCHPRLIDPIRWTPVDEYDPLTVREIVKVEPIPLLAGDDAPYAGWLITETDWQAMKDELRRTSDFLGEAYEQDRDDRRTCSEVDAAKIEALITCREAHWRSFGAGVGAGMGACGVLGIGLSR